MTNGAPRWIGWWFRSAALYGAALLALVAVAAMRAPPAGDGLYFAGFVGTALAFQLAFWIIGSDPVRHRALMPAAVGEKLAFVGPVAWIAATEGVGPATLAAAAVDCALGIGFLIAWRSTPTA